MMSHYRWCIYLVVSIVSGGAGAAERWPSLDFPPDARVEMITAESWVANTLPIRIFEVSAESRNHGLINWLAAEWLRIGQHCLLDAVPLSSVRDIASRSAAKHRRLSCIIDDFIAVAEFSTGLSESAIISLSAPARVKKRTASPTVQAIQTYLNGKILSQEFTDYGIRKATILAIQSRGQPDFIINSLSDKLTRNNWQLERLPGLPRTGLMGRELVAVLDRQRLLISVQTLDTSNSGVIVVIEEE